MIRPNTTRTLVAYLLKPKAQWNFFLDLLASTALARLQQRGCAALSRALTDRHFPAGSTSCWVLGPYPATAPHPVLGIHPSPG